MVNLISENNHVILPIVFGALYSNSKSHWNRQIHNLVFVALKIFMDLNPPFFEEVREMYKQQKMQERQRQVNREEAWTALRQTVLEQCGGDTSKAPKNLLEPIPPMDIGDTSIETDDDYSFMQQAAAGQPGIEGDEQMSMEGPSMDEGQMAAMGIGGQDQYDRQQHMDEGLDDQHGEMHQFPGRPGGGPPGSGQGGQAGQHFRRKSVLPGGEELFSALAAHRSLDDVVPANNPQR